MQPAAHKIHDVRNHLAVLMQMSAISIPAERPPLSDRHLATCKCCSRQQTAADSSRHGSRLQHAQQPQAQQLDLLVASMCASGQPAGMALGQCALVHGLPSVEGRSQGSIGVEGDELERTGRGVHLQQRLSATLLG